MTFHHDGSAGDARLPDLFGILGDSQDAENLRTLGRVRRTYADRIVGVMIAAIDVQDDEPDLEPAVGRRRGRFPGFARRGFQIEGARHAGR